MPVTARPLASDDARVLVLATLGNVNWSGDRFSLDDVYGRPEFAHYARLVPSRGDFGIVMEDGGTAAGVGWVLFLPGDDAGYGYVDDRTPELSLWVAAEHRGHGMGRELLRMVLAEVRRRGLPAVSLSVEEGNPARRLYEQEGFTPVPGREADGVMVNCVRV